jgi:hypothetical protein
MQLAMREELWLGELKCMGWVKVGVGLVLGYGLGCIGRCTHTHTDTQTNTHTHTGLRVALQHLLCSRLCALDVLGANFEVR